MKGFMKFILWCFIVALSVFVLWKAYHFVKYTPWKKSHPKHYLTLKGHINPKIAKDFKFYMDYATSKRSCDSINYYAGVRGVRVKTFPVSLNPDKLGNYEVKIPLDKFRKGFCDWGAYGFGFKYKVSPYGFIGFPSQGPYLKGESLNVHCLASKKANTECFINKEFVGAGEVGYFYSLPPKADRNLQLNFN